MKDKKKFWLVISGSAVGFINGFFGGGGGMVVLPVLTMLFGYEQKNAHATAIAIILPVSIVSIIAYLIGDNQSLIKTDTLFVSLGVIAGGILGAFLLKKISNVWLSKIFAVVMMIAGVKLAFF
ncbi:MAG: sulfite exporter TauE/SafE family protein [Clostridia bacterium]|nr:sulfite exporter TauE/SafE family protein [Clostridia bacterium]